MSYKSFVRLGTGLCRLLGRAVDHLLRTSTHSRRSEYARAGRVPGPYGVISRTKSRSSSVFKSETARNSNPFFFQDITLYP